MELSMSILERQVATTRGSKDVRKLIVGNNYGGLERRIRATDLITKQKLVQLFTFNYLFRIKIIWKGGE